MRINPRCDLLIGNRPENDSDNQYLECEDCHRYEICKKHGCVEMCSPEEIKVAIPSVLEPSYDLLTKEGYFKMSMISEQVKELREIATNWNPNVPINPVSVVLNKAADTIESLSTKLQAANMDRSADCGGWIPVPERMPEEERCIDPETGYYGRSDDVLCSAYNEYEMKDEIWIDYTIDGEWQTHEWYEGEKLAWMPLPASYRESDEF